MNRYDNFFLALTIAAAAWMSLMAFGVVFPHAI